MKRPLLLLAVIPVLAQTVQLQDDAPIDKFRVRTEITFRNDVATGLLTSVEVRTWDVWKQSNVVVFSQPGPSYTLTPEQLSATITNFAAVQAQFAAAANALMTSQP